MKYILPVDQPKNPEYDNFEKYGAEAVRNIYVSTNNEDNSTLISLGIWHLLPEPLKKIKNKTIDFEGELRSSEYDVVLYFHGNSGTRIYPLPTYEVLRKYFHVIAVDYRSKLIISCDYRKSKRSLIFIRRSFTNYDLHLKT